MSARCAVARHEAVDPADVGQPLALGAAHGVELPRPGQPAVEGPQDEGHPGSRAAPRHQARHGRADRRDPVHDVEGMDLDAPAEALPCGPLERPVAGQRQSHQGRPALVGIAAQHAREAAHEPLEAARVDRREVAALYQSRGENGLPIGQARDEVHVRDLGQGAAVRPTDPGYALGLGVGQLGEDEDTESRAGRRRGLMLWHLHRIDSA